MKSLFIAIFCFCMFNVHAQHHLTGTVKDQANGQPVPYATAALLRPDSTIVTGVTTNDAGRFVIDNVKAGNYLVQVSFIGYQKEYRTVNFPSQADMGEISIAESVNKLKEVVVEGRRPLIENKIDRIVVNVAANMITTGANVNELLKQMPGLVVDEEGSVKLNGRPATVYIDGRPTRLPATQVAQMLNGMQGDVVDRVELISNPSSRYEAGESSAIVNIRLKRDASLGVNGSVNVGVGYTEHDMTYRGGANLNYRAKKLNVFGNYGYNNQPDNSDLYQVRNYDSAIPVTYDQHSVSEYVHPNNTLRAGVDWFISPKQTLGFLFNGTLTDGNSNFVSNANITRTSSAQIDSIVSSNSRTSNKSSSQMYNLNYRLLTGSEGEEITADVDYGRVNDRNWQDMQSRYYDAAGTEQRSPTEFQYSGPRDIEILSFKLDYAKPFSDKSKMEAGAKTGQTRTDNAIGYENLYDGQWVPDYSQSNQFKYTERVTAAYATYSRKFGKLAAMAGLRAEYTTIKGESATMDTTFTHSYLDFFPSAYLQYQISDKQGLNLSYSRKINRPGYSLLDPFRTYLDPFTYVSGNPDLNPSYRNTVELRYNFKGYSATAGYTLTDDLFEKEVTQNDMDHTTGITYKNIGKRQALTLGLSAPVDFTKWYTLRTYAEGSWKMDDTRYNGEQFLNNYLSAYVGLQHVFTILPTLKANMQMMWIKPGYMGINQFDDLWSMNAQVEKTLFDKRLSLTLSCNDIFSSMVYYVNVQYQNIDQNIKEDHHLRRTMLTVRYNFGSQKVRGARNRSVGIEEEMGRAK